MIRRSIPDTSQRLVLRRRHSMPSILSRRKIKTAPSPPQSRTPKAQRMNRNTSVSSTTQRDISGGRCHTCGIQLCKVPTRFWKKINKKKSLQYSKPLRIPGKVENGKCLACEEPTCDQPLPPPPPLKRQGNVAYKDFEEEKESATTTMFSMNSFVYEGEYNVYGERHGSGQMMWDDGSRYVGSFFNGLRDGKGTLYLHDGSEYSGDWELNEMHGEGSRHFANNDVYVGHYIRGQRCGQGKMFFANNDLFVGEWKDDKFHGSGRYFTHAQGQAIEGEFVEGKKHGKFKVQHPNDDLDIFKLDNDVIIGHGVRWNANRDKTWILSNPRGSGESWYLGQKTSKKRIPIVEAVSIGYTCEAQEGPPEPLSMMVALASAVPHVNGRSII